MEARSKMRPSGTRTESRIVPVEWSKTLITEGTEEAVENTPVAIEPEDIIELVTSSKSIIRELSYYIFYYHTKSSSGVNCIPEPEPIELSNGRAQLV